MFPRYLVSLLMTLLLMSMHVTKAMAISLAELEQKGDLAVDIYLEPSDSVARTQETNLIVEIKTTGWFTQGTEFKLPELNEAILIQREKFANNSTERKEGETWAVQRWEFSVFPMKAGVLEIPELTIYLQLNVPNTGVVSGAYTSRRLILEVQSPKDMQGLSSWFSASSFNIEQSFNRDLDGLKPGDAFTQTLLFRGEETLAMILPTYAPIHSSEIAVYPRPAKLKNDSSRGNKRAERIQTIEYVVTHEGTVSVPEQTFYYWNTSTWQKQSVSVPEFELQVGTPSFMYSLEHWFTGVLDSTQRPAAKHFVFGIVVIAFLGAILIVMIRPLNKRAKDVPIEPSLWSLKRELSKALGAQDAHRIASALYRWKDQFYGDNPSITLREFIASTGDKLLAKDVEQTLENAYSAEYLDAPLQNLKIKKKGRPRSGCFPKSRKKQTVTLDLYR